MTPPRSAASRRGAFVARLDERLRPLADAIAIQQAAVAELGRFLGASRVGYAEETGDGMSADVAGHYVDGVPRLEGRYRYQDFGSGLAEALRAGRTLVHADVANDAALGPAQRAAFEAQQARSVVLVPLLKDGRLVSVLFLHHVAPRAWSDEELAMIEDVAERTWAEVQRARAEQALRRGESLFQALFASMDEGFQVVEVVRDADGRAIDLRALQANPAFGRITGPDEHVGDLARELEGQAVGEAWLDAVARVAATGEPLRREGRVARLDRWFEIQATRLEPASEGRVAVLLNDVTDRRRAEAGTREALEARVRERTHELEEAGELRRRLLARLDAVQDEERRRIARELHDVLGQQLTAVVLAAAPVPSGAPPQAASDALARVRELMRDVDADLDRLVFQLRPTGLEDNGLAEGLSDYVQTWSQLSGVPVDLLARGLERRRLPQAVEIAVFRVVQEALTNVAKHAAAKQVAITLEASRASLRLTVEDDGRGFDAEAEGAPTSWGVVGMRERIESLGGRFTMESAPDAGTTVLVQVPLE